MVLRGPKFVYKYTYELIIYLLSCRNAIYCRIAQRTTCTNSFVSVSRWHINVYTHSGSSRNLWRSQRKLAMPLYGKRKRCWLTLAPESNYKILLVKLYMPTVRESNFERAPRTRLFKRLQMEYKYVVQRERWARRHTITQPESFRVLLPSHSNLPWAVTEEGTKR